MTIPSPMTSADIDAAGGDPTARQALLSRLRFDAAQVLTDVQKANARTNLDVLGRTSGPIVWGALWPGIDPTGFTDCTSAFLDCIGKAGGNPIDFGGATLNVKGGYIGDVAVNIRNANFLQQQGQRVFLVRKSVTAVQAVSAVGTVVIGAANAPFATMTKIACASANQFARGDVVRLDSADRYPWCPQYANEQGYTSISIYLGDLLKLAGVGQDYTGKQNGGFSQGDIVTTASGASAIVHMVGNNGLATDTIVFRTISGTIANGDALTVGGTVRGTASGTPYLVSAELLTYQALYQTNVTVGKYGNTPFVMEGCSVRALGDVDALVGASQRTAPFVFEGGVAPVIRDFTCYSAWTRCLRYSGVWAPVVDGLHIYRLPNNANPSESAYGYGIDCANATAFGSFSGLTGGNCRHAFTTNTDGDVNGDNYAARVPHYYDGVPKYNVVRDSHITGNISEPFDTHPGDLFTTFYNCVAEWGDGAGLTISGPGGFKTRGFGTKYFGCAAVGGTYGFNDYSAMYNAGFTYSQTYTNCEARRYASVGFLISQAAYDSTQRMTVYDGCWVRDFAIDNVIAPIYPYGFNAYFSGAVMVLRNCGAQRWTGAPWRAYTGQFVTVINFLMDYTGNTSPSATVPRIEGVPASLVIDGMHVLRQQRNPSAPQAFIRNMTNATMYVNLSRLTTNDGVVVGMAEIPPVLESGGGKVIPFRRENGVYIVTASAAPTGPSPVGGNWPAGSEIRFPTPVGGWRGAVCTVAGNPGTWKRFGTVEA